MWFAFLSIVFRSLALRDVHWRRVTLPSSAGFLGDRSILVSGSVSALRHHQTLPCSSCTRKQPQPMPCTSHGVTSLLLARSVACALAVFPHRLLLHLHHCFSCAHMQSHWSMLRSRRCICRICGSRRPIRGKLPCLPVGNNSEIQPPARRSSSLLPKLLGSLPLGLAVCLVSGQAQSPGPPGNATCTQFQIARSEIP